MVGRGRECSGCGRVMARLRVEPDGTLTVGGVQVHGGSWYRCLMPGGWCDVLLDRGPAPDVQEAGPGGWYVALPLVYRGAWVDGLDVMV